MPSYALVRSNRTCGEMSRVSEKSAFEFQARQFSHNLGESVALTFQLYGRLRSAC